jgi:hypothetical protein
MRAAVCHLFISKAALKQWCQLLDPSIYKTSKTFHFAFKHSHRIVYAAAADNCALSTRRSHAHNAHTLLFGRQFRRPVFINAAPRLAQPPSRNCVDAASEKLARPDASEVSRQKIYTTRMQEGARTRRSDLVNWLGQVGRFFARRMCPTCWKGHFVFQEKQFQAFFPTSRGFLAPYTNTGF